MKTIFNDEQFTLVDNKYYSPVFSTNYVDSLTTIECILEVSGTIILETSIDNINWYDTNTVITCTPNGLRTFDRLQPETLYRIKSFKPVVKATLIINN